jgi:hypothetical protein
MRDQSVRTVHVTEGRFARLGREGGVAGHVTGPGGLVMHSTPMRMGYTDSGLAVNT